MSNLQKLDWIEISESVRNDPSLRDMDKLSLWCTNSLVTDFAIIEDKESKAKGFAVNYGGRRPATGFATIDEAKRWAWNHYKEKMQPYIKPSPTWIDAKKQLPQVDFNTQFICKYDSAIEPYVRVATFSAAINEFDYEHGSVLAWMPIPDFKESDCE